MIVDRKRPEYGFGEYGFKHRTQWIFRGSLSSGERTQWVPFSLLFVCKRELTEFFAELTEFAPKLSEAQWVLFSETVLSKQYSARFLVEPSSGCRSILHRDDGWIFLSGWRLNFLSVWWLRKACASRVCDIGFDDGWPYDWTFIGITVGPSSDDDGSHFDLHRDDPWTFIEMTVPHPSFHWISPKRLKSWGHEQCVTVMVLGSVLREREQVFRNVSNELRRQKNGTVFAAENRHLSLKICM